MTQIAVGLGKGLHQIVSGEDIPFEARMLAQADSFDAMTSDKPYRDAMSKEKALAEIERCRGTQFDLKIARVLINMYKSRMKITENTTA